MDFIPLHLIYIPYKVLVTNSVSLLKRGDERLRLKIEKLPKISIIFSGQTTYTTEVGKVSKDQKYFSHHQEF